MIAIIDYGMGNLFSVEKAFVSLGEAVTVTNDPEAILRADRVILPGVGAFGDGMENLTRSGLSDIIKQVVAEQKPLLGICLGLQLLFEGSEEAPGVAGLGLLKGLVCKITASGMKTPHMGWNSLNYKSGSELFRGIDEGQHVYFVHGFHAVPQDEKVITAVTEYGGNITAAVGYGNLQAVQFHPEKSGKVGLQILSNFKELSV